MYQIASAEPKWLELFPAAGKARPVRALFAPPTRAVLRAAARAQRDVLAGDESAAAEAYDAYAAELIRRGLRGWEEIADATGRKALAFDAVGIEVFLADPGLFAAADRAYVTAYLVETAEKNGFSLSPNGTSAAAKGTAKPAKARAPSAPTKSARPSPRKASPSGK
jgi:hypothetical protein